MITGIAFMGGFIVRQTAVSCQAGDQVPVLGAAFEDPGSTLIGILAIIVRRADHRTSAILFERNRGPKTFPTLLAGGYERGFLCPCVIPVAIIDIGFTGSVGAWCTDQSNAAVIEIQRISELTAAAQGNTQRPLINELTAIVEVNIYPIGTGCTNHDTAVSSIDAHRSAELITRTVTTLFPFLGPGTIYQTIDINCAGIIAAVDVVGGAYYQQVAIDGNRASKASAATGQSVIWIELGLLCPRGPTAGIDEHHARSLTSAVSADNQRVPILAQCNGLTVGFWFGGIDPSQFDLLPPTDDTIDRNRVQYQVGQAQVSQIEGFDRQVTERIGHGNFEAS